MEPSKENYLITVRLLADEVRELPIASYFIGGNQEYVLLDWMEKLSYRMEFSSHNWSIQLQDQLQNINDFFRSTGKIAQGDFPFSAQQIECIKVYRLSEEQPPILLRGFPLKTVNIQV